MNANVDLLQLVAATADLCRKPWRHAVIAVDDEPPADPAATSTDAVTATAAVTATDAVTAADRAWAEECCLRLEVRCAEGQRLEREDLELELYRSSGTLNLTLAWLNDPERPMLWHGSHPVWMDGGTGLRCPAPGDGAPLEALARRLRVLLA